MMKTQRILIFAVLALAIGLMAIPTPQSAHAAAGTTGNVSAGLDSVALNIPVAIKAYNLQVSSDYSLEVNDIAIANWTTSSSQTSRNFFLTFDSDDVSDSQVKVALVNGSTGVLDTIYLGVTTTDTWLNPDVVMELIVPLLMFLIVIVIAGAILVRKVRK